MRSRSQKLHQSRLSKEEDDPADFRPVVPIAAFQTVSSAIGVARKLRKLWEPLTFNVADLNLLSRRGSGGSGSDAEGILE